MISVPRGARSPAPGRTKLTTCQPASRNAVAAACPSRPAAPSTRIRSAIVFARARCDETPYRLVVTTDGAPVTRSPREQSMSGFFYNLVPVAVGAVAVVLLLGLANMMRGGSPNTSQKLMRLRVLLQFVAIIVIMTTIWLMGR